MTYDSDGVIELELERLRLKQRRHGERTNSHLATPAIKMIIGDWHVDELGIRTRKITARD
jgi:hypothetical protein